jgi:hypothetical protein
LAVILCAAVWASGGCRSKHKTEPASAPAQLASPQASQSGGIRKIIPEKPAPPPLGHVTASSLVATLDKVLERLDKAGHNFEAIPEAVSSGRMDLGEMERELGAYRMQHDNSSERETAGKFVAQADAARRRLARAIGEATAAQRMAVSSGSWARMDQVIEAAHVDVKATHDLLPSAP